MVQDGPQPNGSAKVLLGRELHLHTDEPTGKPTDPAIQFHFQQKPMQTSNGHELIDDSGTIIEGADPTQFSHLTVVAGKGAAANASAILDILRTEPELFVEVWAITLQSERRWDVHLRNGIDIRLPETDPRTAWSRLAIVDHSKNIIGRDLAVIDLRVPEQLIVEPNIPVRGEGRNT